VSVITDKKMEPDQKDIYSIVKKHVKETEKRAGYPYSLIESLGLKPREVISLVGAGGKTTLMFRLARELFLNGKKVVTSTTTKILEPSPGETAFLYLHSDEEELEQFVSVHLDQYGHITIATERLGSGKLKGISSSLVSGLWSRQKIDYILIEADGAAGRPVKAPREGEPVIPVDTTLVVAVLGVDGVGGELNEENVFQPQRVSIMTGVPIGQRITDEALAILMTDPEGIFRGTPPTSRIIAFINKVDIPNGMVTGKRIAQKIFERKHPQIERVVLGQLKSEPPVAEVIFS